MLTAFATAFARVIRPFLILVSHLKQCVLHLKVYSCTPSFLKELLLGFEARLRHYNNVRNTPLNPQYRDIDIHTRYHPVYFGSIGPLTSAHQDCQQSLSSPKVGILTSIQACYSTSLIPQAGRPTTRTGRIGHNITCLLVYSSSTPWLSLARLRLSEPLL